MKGRGVMEEEKIIKKVEKTGEIIFRRTDQEEMTIIPEALIDVLYGVLSKFESLVSLLDDEDFSKFGFLCEELIKNSEEEFEAITDFIKENIGILKFDRGSWKIHGNGKDKILGMTFIPKDIHKTYSKIELAADSIDIVKQGAFCSRDAAKKRLQEALEDLDGAEKYCGEVMEKANRLKREAKQLMGAYGG